MSRFEYASLALFVFGAGLTFGYSFTRRDKDGWSLAGDYVLTGLIASAIVAVALASLVELVA